MLRLNPDESIHQETVAEAFRSGVELFDLGSLKSGAAKLALLAEAARTSPNYVPGSVRVLIRGDLGEVAPSLETLARIPPATEALFDWVYLVSDPEFALTALGGDHAELYRRIHLDLDALEIARDRGQISGYGIGSAGFTYAKEDPEFLALAPLAENRSGFRFVEFPFNLYESGAFLLENQLLGSIGSSETDSAETVTLLEAAAAFDLHTIARRPFDALTETQLLRLVSYPDHHRLDLTAAVERTLEVALKLEAGTPGRWAHRLRTNLRHVHDPEQWKEIRRRKIDPELREVPAVHSDYLAAMEALLLSVQLWCEKFGAERNERIRSRLVEVAPTLRAVRDLPELLFHIYRSVPGLDSVLTGTRSPDRLRTLVAPARTSPLSIETTTALFKTANEAIQTALRDAMAPTGNAESSPGTALESPAKGMS